jgi:hypothetical protein
MEQHNLSTAQKELLSAVNDITAIYPEGESFFDALDNFIINMASPAIYAELFSMTENKPLILSGGFGKRVAAGIDSGEFPNVPYILFKGGLRKGNEPEIIGIKCPIGVDAKNCVFIDDTIYGGNTYYKIKEFLLKRGVNILKCVAIYDGCPVEREDVSSIFRYYNYFKNVKPNFEFSA